MFTLRRVAVILIPILLALILLCVVGLAFILITNRGSANPLEAFVLRVRLALANDAIEKPIGADPTLYCFQIQDGDTAAQVAERLRQDGFIGDAELFSAYLRYWGLDGKLQVATYAISKNLNIPQVAQVIRDPAASQAQIRVIEGWRIEQIAEVVDQTPGLSYRGSDVMALIGAGVPQTGFIAEFVARNGISAGQSLEGFVYPATYNFPRCENARQLVARMLGAFDYYVTAQMRGDLAAKGLTLYQAVTLASIIEREAIFDDERATIASVYLNRYFNSLRNPPDPNVPTTLDADPTIQYALGKSRNSDTWWPRITQADYRGVISPYNTYLNRGFPPTPISLPRLASIQAAIYPAQTSYTFFQAECGGTGRHRFATTFQEHLANSCS